MKLKQASTKKAFVLYNNLFFSLGEKGDLSMDWSADTPVQSSPLPYVSSAEEHMPSPHVPLSQGSGMDNTMNNLNVETTVLNYRNN